MQLWVHTADAATGGRVGFMDVSPIGAALSLIEDGKAQDARVGAHNLIKSAGNVGWQGHQAKVVDSTFQPVFTKAPTISGLAPVGSTLTCDPGAWTASPAATVNYAWKRDGADLGAFTNTYITVAGDTGADITCEVTLVNTEGTDVAMSNAIVPE